MVMLAAAMAAATPLVTVEDIVATRDISGVTISPDGRWAAYRVSEPSVPENRVALGWHIVGVNGGDHRRVADGGAARFSFAPCSASRPAAAWRIADIARNRRMPKRG